MRSHAQWLFYKLAIFTLTIAFLLQDAQADGRNKLVGRRHRPVTRARQDVKQDSPVSLPPFPYVKRGTSAPIINGLDDPTTVISPANELENSHDDESTLKKLRIVVQKFNTTEPVNKGLMYAKKHNSTLTGADESKYTDRSNSSADEYQIANDSSSDEDTSLLSGFENVEHEAVSAIKTSFGQNDSDDGKKIDNGYSSGQDEEDAKEGQSTESDQSKGYTSQSNKNGQQSSNQSGTTSELDHGQEKAKIGQESKKNQSNGEETKQSKGHSSLSKEGSSLKSIDGQGTVDGEKQKISSLTNNQQSVSSQASNSTEDDNGNIHLPISLGDHDDVSDSKSSSKDSNKTDGKQNNSSKESQSSDTSDASDASKERSASDNSKQDQGLTSKSSNKNNVHDSSAEMNKNSSTSTKPGIKHSSPSGGQNSDKSDQRSSATNADATAKKILNPNDGGIGGNTEQKSTAGDTQKSSFDSKSSTSSSRNQSSSNDGTDSADSNLYNNKGDSSSNNNGTLADGGSGDDSNSFATGLIGGTLKKGSSGNQSTNLNDSKGSSGSDQFGTGSDQFSNENVSNSSSQSGAVGDDTSKGKQNGEASQSNDASQNSNNNSTIPVGTVSGQQSNSGGNTVSQGQGGAESIGKSGSSSTSTVGLTGAGSTGQGVGGVESTPVEGQTKDQGKGQDITADTNTPVPETTTKGGVDSNSDSSGNVTSTAGQNGAAVGAVAGAQGQSTTLSNQGGAQGTIPNTGQTADHFTSSTDTEWQSEQDPTSNTDGKSGQAFGYANSKQLLLPGVVSNQKNVTNADKTGNDQTQAQIPSTSPSNSDSAVQGSDAQSILPSSDPSTIVPTGAVVTQPEGTTMVAILFKPVLSWSFLASSPETVVQIFHYMPSLLAEAVGVDSSAIITIRLQVHNPSEARPTKRSEFDVSGAKSLYLAYVPSETAPKLQDKIRDLNSEFYTLPTEPVAKTLAQNVDPSYEILEMSSVGTANQAASRQSGSGNSTALRNTLIGVGSALATCILAFFLWRLWKKHQKRSRREATQNVLSKGVAQRGTIHSFGAINGLRETWEPSLLEQERVLHGQLAETWEHNNQSQAQPIANNYQADMAFIGGLARPASSRGHPDVFADQVTNRSSQETERSNYNNPQRNTLLSNLNSFDNRSTRSIASHMTEAQRIQQQYFEANSNSCHLESERISPVGAYQVEYERPQQHTFHHAYGPRTVDSRTRRSDSRNSRNSLSTASIGRPEMQCNSMCM